MLTRIDVEYQAVEWGLRGLAKGVCDHEMLTTRAERIAGYQHQLADIVGDEVRAMRLLVEHQAARGI